MKYRIYTTIIFSILFTTLFFIKPLYVNGQDCGSKEECQKKIEEYENKLTETRKQKSSLSSEITYMDTQIKLTLLKIQTTENDFKKTTSEIEDLSGKIDNLNTSLDYLGKILIEKIAQGYKNRETNFFDILLNSDNASVMSQRIKYLKTVQDSDRRMAFKVQQTKVNFEEQKNLREEKKKRLDELKVTLAGQQVTLNNQKGSKQRLLEITKNDEATYQKLLAQAQAQLAGFRSFVQTSGASSVIGANSLGSGSDGAYYSQRDERWAHQTIGTSSENILSVGCLISSIAMVAKKNGDNQTPSSLASDVSRFWGNTAYMNNPWKSVAGKTYSRGVNVDNELANGNYVIVGVGGCSSGGSHFVVLTKKEGSEYIMHDPIYGPDLKFSSHYSNICTASVFK